MFGWIKKKPKSELLVLLEEALQDEGRWLLKEANLWDKKTLTFWEFSYNRFWGRWYITSPHCFTKKEEHLAGKALIKRYNILVKEENRRHKALVEEERKKEYARVLQEYQKKSHGG